MTNGGYLDLTKSDIIKGYINYLKAIAKIYFDFLKLLSNKYSNSLTVGFRWKRKRFPIDAVLKDGTKKRFTNQQEIWFDLRDFTYDIGEDIITVNDLRLKGGAMNGDIVSIFVNKEYEFLPLNGRTILDIGSNIADSAVYFVRQGAKKVYAVEPNRGLYELAKENISLNSMSESIELIFAGCSSNPSRDSYPPFFPLGEMIEKYKVSPDLLKIDCEGCEFDLILNTPDNVLKSFRDILVEYHYGYRKIKMRLEKCGFATKISGPTYYPQSNKPNNQNKKFSTGPVGVQTESLVRPFIGYVYATRNTNLI